ncbi:MAG: disulfide bond formation protein B [Pseudomonadota bacterium]
MIYLFITLSSLFAFLGSLVFEYIFHYKPCLLCVIERFGFASISITTVIYYYTNKKYYIYILKFITYCLSGFLLYHILIEFHFINDEFCKHFTLPDNINVDNLEEFLDNQHFTTCAKRSPTILGIPLTILGLITILSYIILLNI